MPTALANRQFRLEVVMLKKVLQLIAPQDQAAKDATIRRNILRDLAKSGGGVFGSIPEGHRREFFCLDKHTWVWHEEWITEQGIQKVCTTRYDVRPHGIFKAQDGQPYQPVSAEEADRLCSATREYQRRMHEKFDPLLAAQA